MTLSTEFNTIQRPEGDPVSPDDDAWRFKVLTEASPVGIFRCNTEGTCTYLNERAAAMAGMPVAEALGAGWIQSLHRDDRERVLAERLAARIEGSSFRSEYRLVHGDGKIVWVLGQYVPDYDPSGTIVGYVGTATDITRLKCVEEELRLTEQRYTTLSENIAVGIWQITPGGSTIYANATMRRMLELDDDNPSDDLVANPTRTLYDFFTAETRERMVAEHARRPLGVASVYEAEIVGKKGRHRNVLVSGTPLFDANETLTGMVGTFTDITERKHVEEALRQNETRLRLLSEQVPAVLWTTDRSLRFTSSVGGGLAALGLKAGQAVGLTVGGFLELAGNSGDPAIESHQRALAGYSNTYEQVVAGRAFHCHLDPLRGTDGSITGVIGVALDVTERKKAEDALREARDWLETRVKQRTEELTRANEALQTEVRDRKAVEESLLQSQARYASILNSQQTLVSRSDPQGRITYVNAAHQRAFGSKVGDSVFVNVHGEDVEATQKAMDDLVRAPFNCTLEQRCELGGRWRTFLWQVGVIRDRAGEVIEYQGVGFDITDLKQAEEMLRESTRQARSSADEARRAARRERKAAEEARQVANFNRSLAQEVDHRVRNNLAGLLSLVSAMRGSARDVKSFAAAIEGRLLAMSHAHQLLAETDWRPVDLRNLVTSLLTSVERLCPNRIEPTVEGDPAALSARQAPTVSMILMEWFTNSCKYGAHTVESGSLKVTWAVATLASSAEQDKPAEETKVLRLRWIEQGGPPPPHPIAPSLGTQLVRGFASRELKGFCELRYPQTGADHLLEFPLD